MRVVSIGNDRPTLYSRTPALASIGGRDLEPAQHLHQVVVRLAAGDDAEGGVRRLDDLAVERVDLGERGHRVELVLQRVSMRSEGRSGQR